MEKNNEYGFNEITLSYLNIYRANGLTEKGKDVFIEILLHICKDKKDCVSRTTLDNLKEVIEAERDELYDKLPTGEVDAFELIKIIKAHIDELDYIIYGKKKGE